MDRATSGGNVKGSSGAGGGGDLDAKKGASSSSGGSSKGESSGSGSGSGRGSGKPVDFENFWEAPKSLWMQREFTEREIEAIMVSPLT